MPIKRVGQEPATTSTTTKTIKRIENKGGSDGPRWEKDDRLDHLTVFTLREFNADHVGNFGTGPRAIVDVVDVETGERFREVWLSGNLGRDAGRSLEPGEVGIARPFKGTSDKGREFYGLTWAEDEADFERAEKAIAAG